MKTELVPEGEVPVELQEVIRRVRGGETFAAVAREMMPGKHPVTAKVALYNLMLGGLGEERYRDLVTELLVARVAEADEMLDQAADKVAVSKRKAQANFARMDLERRRPALYGPKQEVKHSGGAPQFVVVMPPGGGVVVDGTPVASLPGPSDGTQG